MKSAESVVEQSSLEWLEGIGWSVEHGLEIAPGRPGVERTHNVSVVPEARLRDALGSRLISGEQRVRGAEQFITEAGA